MYYDEQVIDGVLCFRTNPKDKWTPFTRERLTSRILELQAKLNTLIEDVREANNLIRDTTA